MGPKNNPNPVESPDSAVSLSDMKFDFEKDAFYYKKETPAFTEKILRRKRRFNNPYEFNSFTTSPAMSFASDDSIHQAISKPPPGGLPRKPRTKQQKAESMVRRIKRK
jgi:hypothetical protein